VLRWYRQTGGERLTLGFDAHRPEHPGAGLTAAFEAVRAAGFPYITCFERREARLVPID
jgi:histidinol-phosphatase (PHP family)